MPVPKMKIYTEEKAERFLKPLPVARSALVKDIKGAREASKRIKYPLVLKIISPKALHKTEIGGVAVVKSADELEAAFNNLIKIAKKKRIKLTGIYVQEFVSGKEIIIGIKRDPTFGHALMLGIGGKYVELMRDVTFRICPITEKDAEKMISELRYAQLLTGFRGDKGINMDILKKTLVSVSKLPQKHKKLEELDINPFIIDDRRGKIVDARAAFV